MIDTLLHFSGGLDSTYCAYKYLTEHPKKTLLIHHINLINWEGRNEYEAIAVKNILSKFKDLGLNNYKYQESTFDYGTLKKIIYDIEIVAFFTGIIFRDKKNYPHLSNLLIPSGKSDIELHNYHLRDTRRKELITTLKNGRPLNYKRPISQMTKEEVVKALPEELRRLCWYCRRPTEKGTPCGKCYTCKSVPVV